MTDQINIDDFIAQHCEEMTDPAISEALGIPTSRVRNRRRAMGLLKSERKKQPEVTPKTVKEQAASDREKERIASERDRWKALYQEATRTSAGVEDIVDAIREVAPHADPFPVPRILKPNHEVEEETPILLLSDLHYGDVVDERETGGLAVYNTDIARRRAIYTAERAVKMCRHHLRGGYHLPDIEVFGLGDMVSGVIHKELEVAAEVDIVSQAYEAGRVLADMLRILAKNFRVVHFTGVVGNHGRVEQQRYFKVKAHRSWDRVAYLFAKEMLQGQKNITFDIPDSFWSIREVEGRKFLLMHGDQIKSWAGIPFYGLQREYLKWRSLAQSFVGGFDDLVVAHFHTPNLIKVGRENIYINGSLIGGDEFSLGAVSAACDPIQLLFGMNKKRGRTWLFDINSKEVR